MMTRIPKLTDRQKQVLQRMLKGSRCFSPDVVKQLIKKGLVTRDIVRPVYQRMEWGRVVGTLWIVQFTAQGKKIAESI